MNRGEVSNRIIADVMQLRGALFTHPGRFEDSDPSVRLHVTLRWTFRTRRIPTASRNLSRRISPAIPGASTTPRGQAKQPWLVRSCDHRI